MKQDIQPAELHARLAAGERIRIVDVRSPSEFASGHVPAAQNRPLGTMQDPLPGVTPDELLVFVCASGVRSLAACRRAVQSHRLLLNLVGGMDAWRAEGLEVERTPRRPKSLGRQTHLVAGLLLLASFALYLSVGTGWIYLALLPAFGLMLDALTGVCPMTLILKRMPWNASNNEAL